MIFRYARHTLDLNRIEDFYTKIIGLDKIGKFTNHNNYSGIFLGYKDNDWHLEFTVSDDKPNHVNDDDDLLVFYFNIKFELEEIKKRINENKIKYQIPKNPYWKDNGLMISDPDGYKVIFTQKDLFFNNNEKLTELVKNINIDNWSNLVEHVKQLPYGRNLNRTDLSLVLTENKGTCSSKHAFLKKIADLNNFKNVKLILGIYKMNHINTPKIEDTLTKNDLEYIPEAHCYLKLNNLRVDVTNSSSNPNNFIDDIIIEIEINPEQVNTYKIEYHKEFIKKWLKNYNTNLSFNDIWTLREECINKLEN